MPIVLGRILRQRSEAFQQCDLGDVQRIYVGVAQLDRLREDRRALEQLTLTSQGKYASDRPVELVHDQFKYW